MQTISFNAPPINIIGNIIGSALPYVVR